MSINALFLNMHSARFTHKNDSTKSSSATITHQPLLTWCPAEAKLCVYIHFHVIMRSCEGLELILAQNPSFCTEIDNWKQIFFYTADICRHFEASECQITQIWMDSGSICVN